MNPKPNGIPGSLVPAMKRRAAAISKALDAAGRWWMQTNPPRLDAGESLLADVVATRIGTIWRYRGHLIITDRRLFFLPDDSRSGIGYRRLLSNSPSLTSSP